MRDFELDRNNGESYLDAREIHNRFDDLERTADYYQEWLDEKPDPDEFETADEYESALEEWRDNDPGGLDDDESRELNILRELCADLPRDGSLIHEDSFEDHARELARDCFNFDDSSWPANCIDWERAARELRMDYTTFEIDGQTYLTNEY